MRKEAASLPSHEHGTNAYTYQVVDTVQEVATVMRSLISSRAEYTALVTIRLHFEPTRKISASRQALLEQSTHYFLNCLRLLVRRTDEVLLSDHTFYFLLLDANLQGASTVQERLWEALLWRIHNTTENELLRPRSMTIGHSAYPLPYGDVQRCIDAAQKAKRSFIYHSAKSAHHPTTTEHNQYHQLQIRDGELPALARKLGIPYLSLLPRTLPTRVRRLISPKLAQELQCYPLGYERDTLTVAISDPQDCTVLDRLRQETGLHIFPVLAPLHELQIVLEVMC
jgi:hypothetical protein